MQTTIQMPEISPTGVIRIDTNKKPGMIWTAVTYGNLEDNNFSFWVFQDFMKRIKTTKTKRVTAALMAQHHKEALEQLDAIKAEVIAFYKNQAA